MSHLSLDQQLANAKIIYGFFAPLIEPKGAIAAVVNAFCEATFDPAALGDHKIADGLWQLHPDRVSLIKAQTGIDLASFPPVIDQCKAIWHELQVSEKHARIMILAAENAFNATLAWCQYYERPFSKTEPVRRAKLAADWQEKLGLSGL